ncbi:MAG: GspMb/PilO family protein [Burkholderiales bacterium]
MIAMLRSAVDRLGWTGVVGIGLIAFTIAFHFFALAPREEKLEQLRTEADALRERLRSGASIARLPQAAGADQLAAFYAFFPRGDSSPDWLARINDAARSSGITLQSGEYKLERRGEQKLARYQMTLPVVGTYRQLREFIGALLAQVPAASLDEVTLRRESVSSQRIEARVRLTLYLSAGGNPP